MTTWTPEHEVSCWRALVANFIRRRKLYGDNHKRTWDAADDLDNALEGFDGALHATTGSAP